MAVVLDLYQCTLCFQIFNNCLSCLIAIHAGILRICVHDLCIIGHHVDNFQIVPQPHFKVVRVVCRCDLYHAGSEVHFHIIVCHNGDLTVYQRQDQCLSHQIFVAFIVGVDCYGSIAQQGFRTGGRQFQISAAVLQRIPQMPEMPCLHFVFYFCIGNGSQTLRAPVDDTFAAVDQTFLVVLDKYFLDCLAAALVHGKAFSCPVAGGAQLFQLFHDPAAVLLLPCPCTFQKSFSADVLFFDALFPHGFHDLGFGRNGSVVGTRQPQGTVAGHPLPANQNILQSFVQCMTHVQLSGDVRRRDHDGIGLLLGIHMGREAAAVVPHFIDAVFKVFRLVRFRQFLFHKVRSFPFRSPIKKAPAILRIAQGESAGKFSVCCPCYHLNSATILPHSSCTVTGANRHRLPISVLTETSPVLLRGYLLPHCPKTYTDRFLSVRTSGGILLLFSAFLVFFREH